MRYLISSERGAFTRDMELGSGGFVSSKPPSSRYEYRGSHVKSQGWRPSPCYFATAMDSASPTVAAAVSAYRRHANVAALQEQLAIAAESATVEELIAAAEPFRDIPEVTGPLYERVVAAQPNNARALVILASAYWMAGRGPEAVGDLVARALAADPHHQGAWHLWAITEANPRDRVSRWQQVSKRFPADDLALAALADNAASLAGAEHDAVALGIALDAYVQLRQRAALPEQQTALDHAISTLKNWRL